MDHALPGFSHSLGMGSQTGCKGQTLLCGSDRGDFLLFCSWTQGESSCKRRWDTPHLLCATSFQLSAFALWEGLGARWEHTGLWGALSVTAEESRWWVKWGRADGLRRVFQHQAGEIISSLHLPHASCTKYMTNYSHAVFWCIPHFFSVHSMRPSFILLWYIATTLCMTSVPSTWRAKLKSLDINDNFFFSLVSPVPSWVCWTGMYRCTSGWKREERWQISTDLAVLQQGCKGTSSALILQMLWCLSAHRQCKVFMFKPQSLLGAMEHGTFRKISSWALLVIGKVTILTLMS